MYPSNRGQQPDAERERAQSAITTPETAVAASVDGATAGDASVDFDLSIDADSDFSWAILALAHGRNEILENWLRAAREQPAHATHPERAVSDDIPRLYDAVVSYLARTSRTWREPGSPMDDPSILRAANAHANLRAEQGLQPSDVVTEFRLLRRAIWQGLRDHIVALDSVENLVNAELLVNDAIDGAVTIGLERLSGHVESIREDFLVATVHDIRQPITALKGLVQLSRRYLNRGAPEIERALKALGNIEPQIDQLNSTIDELVDASRAALGHLSLEPSFIDLARLLPEIVHQSGIQHLREVRMTLPELGEATGYWDTERLRRVIENLLSNAVKYSRSGDLIEIASHATDEEVEVLVRDHGMGMEEDELPKIFGRFYRTPRAAQSRTEGSGVGLYLCARIIDDHGGTIWAESDGLEQGTTIRFRIPRRPALQSEDSNV